MNLWLWHKCHRLTCVTCQHVHLFLCAYSQSAWAWSAAPRRRTPGRSRWRRESLWLDVDRTATSKDVNINPASSDGLPQLHWCMLGNPTNANNLIIICSNHQAALTRKQNWSKVRFCEKRCVKLLQNNFSWLFTKNEKISYFISTLIRQNSLTTNSEPLL